LALNRNYLPYDGKAPNSPPKFLNVATRYNNRNGENEKPEEE